MRVHLIGITLLLGVSMVVGAPVEGDEKSKPMPYGYEYEVNDPPSKSYYGADEKRDEAGRTEGKYYVWLPDGRLMTVTYYVEGDSGFVHKISFGDNFSPPPPTHNNKDSPKP